MSNTVAILIVLLLASKEIQTGKTQKRQLVSVQHFVKGVKGVREHKCGGVLMTRRMVLTACSCITRIQQDPTTSRKSVILLDSKRIVVYVGTSMGTQNTTRTRQSEVQGVEIMFTHPLCDSEFSYDFGVVVTHRYFVNKGLIVVKTLPSPDKIREFAIGLLDFPRACSTFSWMTDKTAAPCVKLKLDKEPKISMNDVPDKSLNEENIIDSSENSTRQIQRTERKVLDGDDEVIMRTLATKYFANNRIDVDFIEKKYCTGLVSACALQPHGCIHEIHGLRCGEWCMRSLNCTERLCHVDTGSPVFCNKILVGIVTRTRIVNCEDSNQVMAVVSGFDAALQFVRSSLLKFKEKGLELYRNIAQHLPSLSPMIFIVNILIYQI